MRKRKGAIALVAVAALVLAGAVVALTDTGGRDGSNPTSRTEDGGGAMAFEPPAATHAARSGAAADAGVAAGGTSQSDATGAAAELSPPANLGALPIPRLRAEVVKTATLSLEVGRRQGADTVRDVIDAVALVHGFVASSEQTGPRANLTVRVPAADFDATLHRIQEMGRTRDLEIRGEDVTGAVTDLEARLRNLRAQEAVLIELMTRATTIGDSIAVQQQLSQNQEQIEQLEGQRRVLADQTSFGTITVAIAPKGAPAPRPEPQPAGGMTAAWDDAVDAAVAVTGGILVVLGALVPLLALAGIGLVAWRAWVRRQRRVHPPAPAAG
jgi:hypothetical protein